MHYCTMQCQNGIQNVEVAINLECIYRLEEQQFNRKLETGLRNSSVYYKDCEFALAKIRSFNFQASSSQAIPPIFGCDCAVIQFDGFMLIHYYLLKSTVNIRVLSLCGMFCGFMLCKCHAPRCSIVQNSFIDLKDFYAPIPPLPFLASNLATTDLFTGSIIFAFTNCFTVGIIQYISLSGFCHLTVSI